ncbi:unnamed protein product, partial [Closterium sp. NIES-54]
LRHRGPDWSGVHVHNNNFLAHERLAIVDPASGHQPLYNETKEIIVTVNGEIYNHEALKKSLKGKHSFSTESDCEVIAHLYEEHGEELVQELDGIFAFVLLDTRDNSFIAARDPIGVCSMYIGWGRDGSVWFASEMKALKDECERFEIFPPGKIYSSKQAPPMRQWYNPKWFDEHIPDTPYDPLVLRAAFEKAVTKRMMTDVPFGVLLSGGLDSSLVASVAKRHLSETRAGEQWGPHLHSYCVGMEGSPDLKAAKEVAEYIGTVHHELHFTVQEGIDAISDVIYHIETYDVTTIRASTPMFLMSRKIKALGVKMVLSGEGSDEVFGGYLYFHKAPNKEELHKETCHKLKALHQFDCLRANKATMAWGLEARVPFLDKEFLEVAMSIDPEAKMAGLPGFSWQGVPMSRLQHQPHPPLPSVPPATPSPPSSLPSVLPLVSPHHAQIKPKEGRIDNPKNPYLPPSIPLPPFPPFFRPSFPLSLPITLTTPRTPTCLRPSLSLRSSVQAPYSLTEVTFESTQKSHRESPPTPLTPSPLATPMQVSDQMLANAPNMFPINTPQTKEAFFYRMTFEKHFPQVTPSPGPSQSFRFQSAIQIPVSHSDSSSFMYHPSCPCLSPSFSIPSPQLCARLTVPWGKSVACSTEAAVKWDAAWANNIDPSGRAALGVHNASYEGKEGEKGEKKSEGSEDAKEKGNENGDAKEEEPAAKKAKTDA